jgi:hypothetical protein
VWLRHSFGVRTGHLRIDAPKEITLDFHGVQFVEAGITHVNVRSISFVELVRLTGRQHGIPGSLLIEQPRYWDIVIGGDGGLPIESSSFGRSVRKNVDSVEKSANYLLMVTTLLRAVEEVDYRGYIHESGRLQCKDAHSFRMHNKTERILELKFGKKDRIYFYQMNAASSPSGRAILLLMAYHKKDQRTPVDVTGVCERQVRDLLA